jgi:DNA-binding transcriptional ArsR family regulator
MLQSNAFPIRADLADLAQRVLSERLRRAEFFGDNMFAEAGWNIMLDLFVATHRRGRVTVSDASLASNAPHATANRWLQKLVTAGLLVRICDVRDGRRVFVELSPLGLEKMIGYLGTVDLSALADDEQPLPESEAA